PEWRGIRPSRSPLLLPHEIVPVDSVGQRSTLDRVSRAIEALVPQRVDPADRPERPPRHRVVGKLDGYRLDPYAAQGALVARNFRHRFRVVGPWEIEQHERRPRWYAGNPFVRLQHLERGIGLFEARVSLR